jgi:speckle-type POZ protein
MEEQDLSFGMLTPTSQQEGSKQTTPGKSTSKTVTDTIIGEHQHTIVGYSLIKGIGDGEPIASERFEVGGHEWVLLFYPDGKRSSSEVHNLNTHHAAAAVMAVVQGHNPDFGRLPGGGTNIREDRRMDTAAAEPAGDAPAAAPPAMPRPVVLPPPPLHHHSAGNEYCALFVALIGETDSPQGVVSTSEGRVVRAFHRFTLVDQTGRGQDVSKGRRRDQGAVKISCARQDPNARNCHGYRKFVKKSILEDPGRGLLVNDTIVIKYQIELVVSTGGALSRQVSAPKPPSSVIVPPPSLGPDLLSLLEDNIATDVCFDVDGEKMEAHKIILQARSPVFKALLTGPMKEGHEGVVSIKDVRAPVFKSLLHFAYTDNLPSDFQDAMLEVPMAQHLLAAADRFQLIRLRCMCEQRLCDSVSVDTVATTLALAEQNNAKELKRVCLEFVSKNLQSVMASEGYEYLIETCPQLQSELLTVIATTPPAANQQRSRTQIGQIHGRAVDDSGDAQLRRVRPRRE